MPADGLAQQFKNLRIKMLQNFGADIPSDYQKKWFSFSDYQKKWFSFSIQRNISRKIL